MATGGLGRLATKNTCSICLEPFKGRFPKLLPCFHTFCLPCLNQMVTRTVSQVGQFGSGQTETIITCPTCRKDCVVPSGGVAELQKNFYIEQEEDAGQGHLQPIICDLCDQGQVASHRCTRCQLNLCFHCHRGHSNCQIAVRANSERGDDASADESFQQLVEKGRDQMKVVERMLNKLAENKLELNQQRKKLETSLLKKVKSHADAEEDQMKKDEAGLQSKLDAFSQLLSDAEPSSLSAASLRSALLPDADVSKMRGQTELDSKQTDFFKPLSASLNLGSAVQGLSDAGFDDRLLFGDGNQQPVSSSLMLEASQLQQAARVNELAQKVDMLMRQAHVQKARGENKELIAEIRAMHDKNTILLQEVATVQGVVQALQTENEKLQMESGRIRKDVTDLKAESGKTQKDVTDVKAESGKMQKDVSLLQSESGKTQQDVTDLKSDCGKIHKDVSVLQSESGQIQSESGQMQKKFSDIKSENGNLRRNLADLQTGFQDLSQKHSRSSSQVVFYAFIDSIVKTKARGPVIFDCVSSNIGDGYDTKTGIFTVPVSGVYMFSASIRPAYRDKNACVYATFFCNKVNRELTLFVLLSYDKNSPCCGQGVHHFAKGERVFLDATEGCSFSSENGVTFFCGALIQPDL